MSLVSLIWIKAKDLCQKGPATVSPTPHTMHEQASGVDSYRAQDKGFLQKFREEGNNKVPGKEEVQLSLRCEEGLHSQSVNHSTMNKGNDIISIYILLRTSSDTEYLGCN